jgi:signal transduction histidine kinase/CheY-like chemotaxis protein
MQHILYFEMNNLFETIRKTLKKASIIRNFNVYVIGVIGLIGHPTYWLWWTYVDPQPWEKYPVIRIIGFFTCLFLLLIDYWPKYLKKVFFKPYWFFVLVYNLPFFFIFHLLSSQASAMWLSALFPMTFLITMVITKTSLWVLNILLGGISAVILSIFLNIDLSAFTQELILFTILPVLTFAVFTAFIYSYSNANGLTNEIERREELNKKIQENKIKVLESLGGSIAHEMRNPLGSIHQSTYILKQKLKEISESKKTKRISIQKEELIEISKMLEIIDHSLIRGNMVIDMILSNIHKKEIDKSKFKICNIDHIVKTTMTEFAFSSGEKKKVFIDIQDDFLFKGDENLMVFVLFNLLKNALYYIKTYPKSVITISTRKKKIEEREVHYLYFKDTGAGVPEDKLESIFESFMTSGKKEGTGLGLPFCRRVMTAFNGTITCNSKLQEYTEFVLSFPQLSKDEIKVQKSLITEEKEEELDVKEIIKKDYNNKTILLIDDVVSNIMIGKRRLNKLGFKVKTAEYGKNALEILDKEGNDIDIILTDLQMPEIDGYMLYKLIREGFKNKEKEKFTNFNHHKTIPIIAFTGNTDNETLKKIADSKINNYIQKSFSDKELLKVLKNIQKSLKDL